MSGPNDTQQAPLATELCTSPAATARRPGALDATVIGYLVLPLALFLAGWFKGGVAVLLLLTLVMALMPIMRAAPCARAPRRLELGLALATGLAWSTCAGVGHWVFANPDWPVRDAVLHDLVVGHWPVGYGLLDQLPTVLRAPLGFYLPAALVGKLYGLEAAHVALWVWTALGVTLFLLQVLTLLPERSRTSLLVFALLVIVLFSGLDVVGNLAFVPGFVAHWQPGQHLEWWAGRYQYSSMTTQLFWVPNHALGAWLGIGLLARIPEGHPLDRLWPVLIIALALCSPLSALGLVPFVLARVPPLSRASSARVRDIMQAALPGLVLGIAVASYLGLDAGRIPRGLTFGRHGSAGLLADFGRQGAFFVLEAGLIGVLVLTIVRSRMLVLALLVLALLPMLSFGAANDLVMRGSIPALALLAIATLLALLAPAGHETALVAARTLRPDHRRWLCGLLGASLAIGAVTPVQEIVRALELPRWPANLEARLIDAACGRYPAHYVARLRAPLARLLLRGPSVLAPDSRIAWSDCHNFPLRLMRARGLL